MTKLLCCTVALLWLAPWAFAQQVSYSGMSDASAAVALDATTFIVADDEKNVLQVYRAGRDGPPLHAVSWNEPLGIQRHDEHPEVDVEGAASLGGRIYWIASHGRNKDGKWRPNRHRFFATTVRGTPDAVFIEPFGRARDDLIAHLVRAEAMRGLGLQEALGKGKARAEKLAPKRKGINVEGLCAAQDGKSLLIALRNPLPDDKALLVPLHNPEAVVARGDDPQFGRPILLPLQASLNGKTVPLGIRGIEYSRRHAAYLILAGPADQQRVFAVYTWSGETGERPRRLEQSSTAIMAVERFVPETLMVYPHRQEVHVLSDDGTRKVKVRSPDECKPGTYENGYCEAKHLLDERKQTFRGIWIDVN